jgi:hypothetical protein
MYIKLISYNDLFAESNVAVGLQFIGIAYIYKVIDKSLFFLSVLKYEIEFEETTLDEVYRNRDLLDRLLKG